MSDLVRLLIYLPLIDFLEFSYFALGCDNTYFGSIHIIFFQSNNTIKRTHVQGNQKTVELEAILNLTCDVTMLRLKGLHARTF